MAAQHKFSGEIDAIEIIGLFDLALLYLSVDNRKVNIELSPHRQSLAGRSCADDDGLMVEGRARRIGPVNLIHHDRSIGGDVHRGSSPRNHPLGAVARDRDRIGRARVEPVVLGACGRGGR